MRRKKSLTQILRTWFLLNLTLFACFVSARAQTNVVPFVDEVIVNPQAQRATAYFGYQNPNSRSVTIRIGEPYNYFNPEAQDRGQPEQFLPGTHHYAFAVVFDYSQNPTLAWFLDGASVAIADSASAGGNTPQTTAFTYQGRLTDANAAANGPYQMRFTLFDTEGNGTQIGSSIEMTNVLVTAGLFAVPLDFGSAPFANGSSRFLQIEVRPGAGGTYTTLAPRQRITSTPYATRAFSAATADTATSAQQLSGTSANLFVQTNDPRLSDARSPTAGSANYIQNRTTPQANSHFNISGNGVIGGNLTVGGTINGGITNFGQSATTVYGTGQLVVNSSTTIYTLIPGLSQTINVPSNSVLLVSTDGGIQSTGTSANSFSVVDLGIFVDGVLSTSAGQRRITILNGTGLSMIGNWSMTVTRELAAGNHTFEVRAINAFSGSPASPANVSSGSAPQLQGQLTIAIIKK